MLFRSQGLGYIYDTQGQRFTAVGKYENHVKDALILSIPGKTILSKQTTTPSGALVKTNVTYDLLIFSDLSAKINMDTAKNLILTKVMGRDRSRKELVSNDDLFFSVQGKVVSDYPDIYPTVQVQRLMEIANYKGIVSVKIGRAHV